MKQLSKRLQEARSMKSDQGSSDSEDVGRLKFRKPRLNDGARISELIRSCKPLDINSTYCYLLLCRDFADTCVIWQIAVDVDSRNRGIAKRMLFDVLNRPSTRDCRYIETTISPSNEASKRLFRGLAQELDAHCDVSDCFSESDFGDFDHEAECLFNIGPFKMNG